ncbi:hypothetical protein [Paenibacillus kribbensis]|uniref:hypothetical protein n=1 Tax=Paenibacillus kribbensis TaxID=172713 RepID=UPI0008398F32|nr:hypothetical protein [Paenibacillus kribbensis]
MLNKIMFFTFSLIVSLVSCYSLVQFWLWDAAKNESDYSEIENGLAIFAVGLIFSFILLVFHIVFHINVFIKYIHQSEKPLIVKNIFFSGNKLGVLVCCILLGILILGYILLRDIPLNILIVFSLTYICYSVWVLQIREEKE